MKQLPQIQAQVPLFQVAYDAATMDAAWLGLSSQFRDFWTKRILASGVEPISDADCDPIIRILDRNAKGNTRGSQAVARAMIPQGAWRRMLNELHTRKPLGQLLNSVLTTNDPKARASIIDELYLANDGVPNYLTGPSGNAVCAFLAAHAPLENLSIISLKDRRTLVDLLGLNVPFDWDTASIGTMIAMTNGLILDGAESMGLTGSARTVSRFFYIAGVEPLWKGVHTVAMPDGGSVSVTVPGTAEEEDSQPAAAAAALPPGSLVEVVRGPQVGPQDGKATAELLQLQAEIRESMQIQALLAKIGAEMGFTIWLPKADRSRVLKAWIPGSGQLLETLPLGYDPTTTATIEQIDVLWLKGRSIVRAFEVEHTTSIYSGLLRMADLVALQPNIAVKLHIVAGVERRDKVLREIRRPVFSLLDGLVLWKTCTYLSYDRIREISELKHLDHLKDGVLNEYEETASGETGVP